MNYSNQPIIGYSVNDLYYENPTYCKKDKPELNPYIPTSDPEDNCTINSKPEDCPCTINEYYGKILKQKKYNSDNELNKYTNSTYLYNLQIIHTINYSFGIGIIFAYLLIQLK